MNSNLTKFLAGVFGLAIWSWLAYIKMTPIEPLIDLLKMGLGGLVVHMLQDGATAPAAAPVVQTPAPGGQAGFATPRILIALASVCIGLAMLSGCTTTTASMYRGYASQAEAGVKMWDDNTIATVRVVLCAQPYSAIQRHPELQPGVQALCGPLANAASLDANQLSLLMQLLGKAGVGVAAVPAASAASGAK